MAVFCYIKVGLHILSNGTLCILTILHLAGILNCSFCHLGVFTVAVCETLSQI